MVGIASGDMACAVAAPTIAQQVRLSGRCIVDAGGGMHTEG